MQDLPHNDRILKRLTAVGRGAVAVSQLSGDDGSAIDRCFVAASGSVPSATEVNRIRYGDWGGEDVVVVRTAERCWEIHCHGGHAAVERIMRDLDSHPMPTPVNERTDDEATDHHSWNLPQRLMQQLLKCRTLRTASFLLAQQHGILEQFLNRTLIAPPSAQRSDQIERFLNWSRFAQHLTDPWRVAIVGQPNAGKSRLLNAIVGYERSIVFDQPGTTRDLVEADIVLAGWPMQITDTAGIRTQATDAVETAGVAFARASLHQCDACLLVVDALLGWTAADSELLSEIPRSTPVAVLLNKTDLLTAESTSGGAATPPAEAAQWQLDQRRTDKAAPDCVQSISAATGHGIDSLLEWLPQTLLPQVPKHNEPLPVIPEVAQRLAALL